MNGHETSSTYPWTVQPRVAALSPVKWVAYNALTGETSKRFTTYDRAETAMGVRMEYDKAAAQTPDFTHLNRMARRVQDARRGRLLPNVNR